MSKKSGTIILLPIIVFILSGCIPPFYDGGIAANTYFEEDVNYTTFTLAIDEPNGFVESNALTQKLENYVDENEKNIPMMCYKEISFTVKNEGIKITEFAFILQAEDECIINLAVYYGENLIASESISLGRYTIQTAYFSELDIMLQKREKLSVVITNPLVISRIQFRTDSYIFIGQEV